MPRYILIDSNSGYIFGDTADYAAGADLAQSAHFNPVEAARLLDESIGEYGRAYVETGRPRDTRTGYHVYRADMDGSDAVPVVWDGQDQETIEAVERDCEYVGFVECKPSHDA